MAARAATGRPEDRELVLSRVFDAPPWLVFEAWSSVKHLARWFCPSGFTVPDCVCEFRVGGRFEVCMRSSDGKDHWSHTSMMVWAGSNFFTGNRVVGATDSNQVSRPLDPVTLTPQSGGVVLTPEYVHQALRDLAGIRKSVFNDAGLNLSGFCGGGHFR